MLNKTTWPNSTRSRDLPTVAPQEPIIDLVEAFRQVRRQWKLVASIIGLVISLGVIYLMVTPTRFTASSLLLFDIRQVQPFQQQYPNSVADSAYVDSQVEVLKAESTARSVIGKLNLLSDPEFATQGSGLFSLVGTIFNAVLGARNPSAEVDQWTRAISILQGNLTIKRIGLTYIIQIGYRSPDKDKAAQISNAVAQAYILGQLDSKYQAARYADAWLQDRISSLKAQSQSAERAVAEFKASNNVVDTAARPLTEQQLADLSNERRVQLKDLESAAQTYRMLYETFLQRVTEVTQQQSFPAMESRVVSEASTLLVKRDPNVLLVLGAVSLLGVVCALGVVFAREHFGTGLHSSREVEKEVGIDCLGILPTIKPAREIAKRLRESLRFQTADRVISALVGRHRFVVGEPFSRFAETIRSLKVTADTVALRRPNKVIGVTSARHHEGKSVVAANLSEMIALSGSRALLIDCNPRNVGLTDQLAPKATAGLMDIVAGQAAVKDLVWSDPATTVEFLPAVKNPVSRDPNANEEPAILYQRALLAPAGLQKLLQSVEDCYDYVVLDLPPITVADVKATSHLVDCFILVIEWGRTSRQVVIDALNTAPLVSEKLLGAVLNKADPTELRRLDS